MIEIYIRLWAVVSLVGAVVCAWNEWVSHKKEDFVSRVFTTVKVFISASLMVGIGMTCLFGFLHLIVLGGGA